MESLNSYIVGTCREMCPLEETEMREKRKLLHVLEILPGTETDWMPKADRSRMVKSFSRSAAGKAMQDPKNLRPPDVLLKTLNYLLEDVISRKDISWTVIYDFIMDRLRSVRQDLVIQNASHAYCISILQPIVRFHAYASYRLCEEDINNFDPVINSTHLQECLKRLLCMYDCCDELYETCHANSEEMNSFLVENRPHFEAFRTDLVETALELSLSYRNNNFVRVCRIIKQLPTLLLAVGALYLPKIRRNALKVMSVAYSCKNLVFPATALRSLLLYDDEEALIKDCKYYGLSVQERGLPPVHQDFINERLNNTNISTLILFGD
ncbi:hypothetical protein NQ315_008458 [Exocentrus adspersus]|uniref:SAC3/GANP/THP3 conserved domain-containing protein n=1 Tax=Exocentrus adspersus TaxID=1586481 RepID=A0AAV8W5B5_9CUCU|nr:hypothetical protein NQ315_008458 [Exocentrus adspersus]